VNQLEEKMSATNAESDSPNAESIQSQGLMTITASVGMIVAHFLG